MRLVVELSNAFELLLVSDSEDSSVTSWSASRSYRSSANAAQMTVCARTTATHSFHLVALKLGNINFTVQVDLKSAREKNVKG